MLNSLIHHGYSKTIERIKIKLGTQIPHLGLKNKF